MPNPQIDQHLSYFKRVSLFRHLDEAQIKKIIALIKISESLYISPSSNKQSLQEKALNRLTERSHSFFGEMALFLEKPERSASIKAVKPCTLAVLEKRRLLNILDKDPIIGSIIYKNISTELCKRLIKSNKDVLKLTTAFSLALEGD
jgi:CRP-like cAMP-binding protein